MLTFIIQITLSFVPLNVQNCSSSSVASTQHHPNSNLLWFWKCLLLIYWHALSVLLMAKWLECEMLQFFLPRNCVKMLQRLHMKWIKFNKKFKYKEISSSFSLIWTHSRHDEGFNEIQTVLCTYSSRGTNARIKRTYSGSSPCSQTKCIAH